jgi:hypothetical protein
MDNFKEGREVLETNQCLQAVLDNSIKLSCRQTESALEGEVNFTAGWFEEWPEEARIELLRSWICILRFTLNSELAVKKEAEEWSKSIGQKEDNSDEN